MRAWLLTVATAALGAVGVGGCDHPVHTGNVSLHVTLDADRPVDAVIYELVHDLVVEVRGSIGHQGNGSDFTRLVSHVPAGAGYFARVTGRSRDGKLECDGGTRFDVRANATTAVNLGIGCRNVGDGQVVISVGIVCPGFQVEALNVSPLSASVGGTISVGASASPFEGGVTTFQWSAGAGAFAKPNEAQTLYTCTQPGPATLSVTASHDVCRDTQSVTVQCAGDAGPGD